MRRKRSTSYDQGHDSKITNVRAVVAGLDGVGKSGRSKKKQAKLNDSLF